jgi:hypothetical protein
VEEKNGEQVGPEIEKKNTAELLWCGAHASCCIQKCPLTLVLHAFLLAGAALQTRVTTTITCVQSGRKIYNLPARTCVTRACAASTCRGACQVATVSALFSSNRRSESLSVRTWRAD